MDRSYQWEEKLALPLVGYFDVPAWFSENKTKLPRENNLIRNTDWYLYNFRLALAYGLRGQGHEVVLLSPPGDYGPLLEKAGFRWVPFPLSRRGTNPLRDLVTIWKLYQFL